MKKLLTAATALGLLWGSGQAQAGNLALTAAGINLGFTLSTFATLNPGAQNGFGFGPFGLAASGANIVVSNSPSATRYVFSDTDGQTIGTALNVVPSNSGTAGYGAVGGVAYGSQNNQFVRFNPNGTVNSVLVAGISPYLGMAGDNARGTIIATSSAGLVEIDPVAATYRVINGNVFGDGVTVSPDGTTIYVEVNNAIIGYDVVTGAQVFTSGFLAGGPDGAGVIVSNNSLNGQIVINFNNGFVDLLDPITHGLTVIADGGSRGDYVFADPNNGSLLLDFSEGVLRLTCGVGCTFGPPPPPPVGVPEPMTLSLLGAGLLGLAAARTRTRTATAQAVDVLK